MTSLIKRYTAEEERWMTWELQEVAAQHSGKRNIVRLFCRYRAVLRAATAESIGKT